MKISTYVAPPLPHKGAPCGRGPLEPLPHKGVSPRGAPCGRDTEPSREGGPSAPLRRGEPLASVHEGIKQKKVRKCIVTTTSKTMEPEEGFVLHITKQSKSELKQYINTLHRTDTAYERLARKWHAYDVEKRVRRIQTLALPASIWQCCSSHTTCVCNQEIFQHFLQRVCKRQSLASTVYQIFLQRGHARMYARMQCVAQVAPVSHPATQV